nr:hypothetical protein [Bacilli bacterium]
MNNKGQVLVIFLLLIPILLVLLTVAVDVGNVMIKTYKVKSVMKEAITYGLEKNDLDGAETLLIKNEIKDYKINSNNNIEIEVKGSIKPTFPHLFDRKDYEYSYKYLGYLEEGKVTIVKE